MRQCGQQRPQPPPAWGQRRGTARHPNPPRPPTYARCRGTSRCPSRGPAPLGLLGGAQSPQPLGPPPGVGRRRADPGAARIASPVPEGARRCPRGAARGCPRISFLLYLARPHCARPPTRAVAIVTPQFELPNFSRASCLPPPPPHTKPRPPAPLPGWGGAPLLPLPAPMGPGFPQCDPPLPRPFCMGLPRGSPTPGGVLGGCVASRGVARLRPQQRSPPNASQRAGAFLPTAVVAALLCIDVVKGEGSGKSQEHKHGGA